MSSTESLVCSKCSKQCKDKKGLSLHTKRCEYTSNTTCEYCNDTYKSVYILERHLLTCVEFRLHKQREAFNKEIEAFNKEIEAFNKKIEDLTITYETKISTLKEDLTITYETKISTLKEEINKIEGFHKGQIKTYHDESYSLNREIQLLNKELKQKTDIHEQATQEYKKKESIYNRKIDEFVSTISSLVTDHTSLYKMSLQQAYSNNNNNMTINNFHNNTVQLYNFDPSKFRGKIPSNRLITSEDQLVHHLIENGIKNYYRVTDRSRGTIVWINQKGQEIRDSGGTALTSQLYDTLHEDFLAQKEYSSQQLKKEGLSEDQENKFRRSVNVSDKILQKNPIGVLFLSEELLRVV